MSSVFCSQEHVDWNKEGGRALPCMGLWSGVEGAGPRPVTSEQRASHVGGKAEIAPGRKGKVPEEL